MIKLNAYFHETKRGRVSQNQSLIFIDSPEASIEAERSHEGTSKMEIEFDSISGTKGAGCRERERERGTIVAVRILD